MLRRVLVNKVYYLYIIIINSILKQHSVLIREICLTIYFATLKNDPDKVMVIFKCRLKTQTNQKKACVTIWRCGRCVRLSSTWILTALFLIQS